MKNPKVKLIEKPVAVYDYNLLQRIKLPLPSQTITMPFNEVIEQRRSVRKFKSVTLAILSDLLWYTAKVRTLIVQENNYILTHRGVPSAGARHPIDIILHNPELFGSGDLYYYNPFDHSINQMADSERVAISLALHVNEIVPVQDGLILWFIAHLQRTSAKYDHPESLIWRDCGALINSIQLTCTGLKLNSCPIGSLGEPFISDFFGKPDIFGVGGLVLGS